MEKKQRYDCSESPALQAKYAKERKEYTADKIVTRETVQQQKSDDPIAIYQEMDAQWNGA